MAEIVTLTPKEFMDIALGGESLVTDWRFGEMASPDVVEDNYDPSALELTAPSSTNVLVIGEVMLGLETVFLAPKGNPNATLNLGTGDDRQSAAIRELAGVDLAIGVKVDPLFRRASLHEIYAVGQPLITPGADGKFPGQTEPGMMDIIQGSGFIQGSVQKKPKRWNNGSTPVQMHAIQMDVHTEHSQPATLLFRTDTMVQEANGRISPRKLSQDDNVRARVVRSTEPARYTASRNVMHRFNR